MSNDEDGDITGKFNICELFGVLSTGWQSCSGVCGRRDSCLFRSVRGYASGGQEFTIDVVVGTEANPAYNVTSSEIAFTFNPAILQVESVTVGPYLATTGSTTLPMTPSIDNRNGAVSGAAEAIVGSKAAPTGTGVIWTITFRATAEGTSEVNFTRVWLAEPPGMPEDLLPVTIKNGIFTVRGGAVSPGTKSPTGTPPTAPLSTPFATSTPTPKEPGFEAAGALAGLSLIAYALLRSRT